MLLLADMFKYAIQCLVLLVLLSSCSGARYRHLTGFHRTSKSSIHQTANQRIHSTATPTAKESVEQINEHLEQASKDTNLILNSTFPDVHPTATGLLTQHLKNMVQAFRFVRKSARTPSHKTAKQVHRPKEASGFGSIMLFLILSLLIMALLFYLTDLQVLTIGLLIFVVFVVLLALILYAKTMS
ncbi:MAG: hypothetical protein H6608_12755 [Flavobacteriales bacterium]|nr:hypothetical protein [Bacteroidota bacterium]MCB9242003.1 hypothetical protein [Flavobacteriales bacterium]